MLSITKAPGEPDMTWHSAPSIVWVGTQLLVCSPRVGSSFFMDWSPAYRLFNQARVDTSKLFDVVRCGVLQELDSQQFIIGHMDDTLIKKTGKRIPGHSLAPGPSGTSLSNQFYLGPTFPANINGLA